jgi:hypothetical protein
VQESDGDLAIGITEPNPNFVWPPGEGEVEQPFARWRDAFERLRPAYYRLRIDWASLQPTADQPANSDLAVAGCMREVPPCGAWAGVREQLKAAGARQKKTGMQIITVLAGTPAWAARSPERLRAGRDGAPLALPAPLGAAGLPQADRRRPRRRGAGGRRAAVLERVERTEPSRFPFTAATRCSGRAATASVAPYVRLVRALKKRSTSAPGEPGVRARRARRADRRTPRNTAVEEFARALPNDLVCGARAWSQHAYVGGRDPVDPAGTGIATHDCVRSPEFWITETGVGAASIDRDPWKGATAERSACRAMRSQLLKWYEDPA